MPDAGNRFLCSKEQPSGNLGSKKIDIWKKCFGLKIIRNFLREKSSKGLIAASPAQDTDREAYLHRAAEMQE